MPKTLFLIRHAHRDTDNGRELDNGLSEKGKAQADKILNYFQKKHSDVDAKLISSPKKRCIETIKPLEKIYKRKIEIFDLLNEGYRLEKRIKEFIEWWIEEAPEYTILCSHGDWIPYCIEELTGARVECKKSSIAEIGASLTSPLLINLIQKP
jgi:broad specificity phosphatase PhoE